MYFQPTNKFFNKKGFSILEAVIVLGIVGVVSVGISQLIISLTSSAALIEDKMNAYSLKQELQMYLNNEQSCNASLAGIALQGRGIASTSSNVQIRDRNNNIILSTRGESSQYNTLQIGSITVSNVDIPSFPGEGLARVAITLERTRGQGAMRVIPPLDVLVAVNVNNSGRIVNCEGGGLASCAAPSSPNANDLKVYKHEETFRKWVLGTPSMACGNRGERIDTLHEFTCNDGRSIQGAAVTTRVGLAGENDCRGRDP